MTGLLASFDKVMSDMYPENLAKCIIFFVFAKLLDPLQSYQKACQLW